MYDPAPPTAVHPLPCGYCCHLITCLRFRNLASVTYGELVDHPFRFSEVETAHIATRAQLRCPAAVPLQLTSLDLHQLMDRCPNSNPNGSRPTGQSNMRFK